MPGKSDHFLRISLDVLDYVLFQNVVRHAKRLSFWIELSFLQVITIVTVQVANGADRLHKNLELSGSLSHLLNVVGEDNPKPILVQSQARYDEVSWKNSSFLAALNTFRSRIYGN